MVFKPSFKCFKNEKIIFIQVILKLECLFYQNIYILFHLILYSQSHFDSKKRKKVVSQFKKHAIYAVTTKFLYQASEQTLFPLNLSAQLRSFPETVNSTYIGQKEIRSIKGLDALVIEAALINPSTSRLSQLVPHCFQVGYEHERQQNHYYGHQIVVEQPFGVDEV